MVQTNLFGEVVGTQNRCQVTAENGMLVVKTPYDPGLVAAIKGLPNNDRRWDQQRKVWLVDPKHGQRIAGLCAAYLGESIQLPRVEIHQASIENRLLEVHYVTQTKSRGGDERSAFGLNSTNQWFVGFPEKVLRKWFMAADDPSQALTLYGVLGIGRGCTGEELKTAYRRAVMQWHPDRCRELNAQEMFLRVQEAWDVLGDPNKRARYDAGLALEASLRGKTPEAEKSSSGYRSPLRCGLILANGVDRMGIFWVSEILAWEDIINNQGQMLITSWRYGEDRPTRSWA